MQLFEKVTLRIRIYMASDGSGLIFDKVYIVSQPFVGRQYHLNSVI